MIDDIQRLLNNYIDWLRDRTTLRQIDDGWVEITTPYLDRHNDHIQIYARKDNGGYLLTDDSYIIHDLELSGCNMDSPKRQALLRITLNGFGVKKNNNSLEVHASGNDFAQRKHNLLQAMLAVNDLFYLSAPMVESLFYEDVESWLNVHEIRYTPRVKFTGTSGFDYLFDFVIPKSRTRPERILQTINRPSRDTAQRMAFSWVDTKEARPTESHAYAFINDYDKKISTNFLDALNKYEVTAVPWSERESFRSELAA
jgi:hypothetical protein